MALRSILPPDTNRLKVDNSFFIVNIVLLLILFFLATGQLLNSPSFGVDLSETEELPIETLPAPLLIVEEDGGLLLDGEPIQATALQTALEGQSKVHLLIARQAPATDLLALISRPELSQIEIRLVTIHDRSEEE